MVEWQISEPASCVLVELSGSECFRLITLGSASHPWPMGFWQILAHYFVIHVSAPCEEYHAQN